MNCWWVKVLLPEKLRKMLCCQSGKRLCFWRSPRLESPRLCLNLPQKNYVDRKASKTFSSTCRYKFAMTCILSQIKSEIYNKPHSTSKSPRWLNFQIGEQDGFMIYYWTRKMCSRQWIFSFEAASWVSVGVACKCA